MQPTHDHHQDPAIIVRDGVARATAAVGLAHQASTPTRAPTRRP